MHEPVMEGGGFYNQHSELQARSAEEADGMLERALAAITLPPGPLTIADFGSSQGHNSMRQMALVLDRLTKHTGQSRDIMVVHTDLPHNDFTSLFEMLETAQTATGAVGTMFFPSAIGHSFYERLLPADSLAFGWSAFAIHWMSALPLTRPSRWRRWRQPIGEAFSLTAPKSWHRAVSWFLSSALWTGPMAPGWSR